MDKSIWEDYRNKKRFPSLNQNIETKVLIIGGGLAGILCAHELKNRNIDSVLVEKDYIGCGISKNTTAFLSVVHDFSYHNFINKFGIEKAKEYFDITSNAIEKYKQLSKLYDFDFVEQPLVLYSQDEYKINNEKKALESLQCKVKYTKKLEIADSFKKAIEIDHQANINPLKLIDALAKELTIFEHSKITKIKDNIAYCNGYSITFENVIIATNYPIVNKKGLYFLKLQQKRSYVAALKNEPLSKMYANIDDDGRYYRTYNDYILIGGNDRNTKEKCLESFYHDIKKDYNTSIDYYWSNQDCVSLDQIPYIGTFNRFHNNWYVTTGFNLYGLTWAMASSFILADMIEKKVANNYNLLSPKRSILNKKLLSSLWTTMTNLINFNTPRCKHMGCALKYNIIEKTYECPCHGSRYDENGKLLNGPSQKDLKLK